MLDTDFFRRWMAVTAAAVDREADRLTELDAAIGDADHGSNMRRGFAAVNDVLEKEDLDAGDGADAGRPPPDLDGRRSVRAVVRDAAAPYREGPG